MAPTLPSASKLLDDADVLVALPGGVGRRAYAATLDHHPAAAGAGEGGAGEGGGTGRGRRTVLSVTSVVACAVDKLVLRAHRRGSGEELLLLLLRHTVRYEQ